MGCEHSKKKAKKKKEDGDGSRDIILVKQLERLEWQLKILKRVSSANEFRERVELLKEHADEDVCSLVLDLLHKVKTETTSELETLQQHKRIEERDLIETFKVTEIELKAQIGCLEAELEDYKRLKQKVDDSTIKKAFNRNVQLRGSPGAFWESEHESLLFVIEMKTERVQDQSKKLQQMDLLVEKKRFLQDQMVEVLRQNEDLRVRVGQFQSNIQQMSAKQHDLTVALERQEAANRALSQEKDELMFKLRH